MRSPVRTQNASCLELVNDFRMETRSEDTEELDSEDC